RPSMQTVQLMLDTNNMIAPAAADFQAFGTMKDGSTQELTGRVQWPSSVSTMVASNGHVTVTAPGSYNVTAKSGSIQSQPAKLLAQFSGSFAGDGFDTNAQPSLDAPAMTTGGAQIAYPLEGALFPKNLGPIYVHIIKTGNPTSARL